MYCKHCGAKIDDNSVFCEECGNKVTPLNNNSTTNVQLENNAPSNQTPSSQFNTMTNNEEPVNTTNSVMDIMMNPIISRILFLSPVVLFFFSHLKVLSESINGFDLAFNKDYELLVGDWGAEAMLGAGIFAALGVIKPNAITPFIVLVLYLVLALSIGSKGWNTLDIGFYIELIANAALILLCSKNILTYLNQKFK